MGLRRATTQPLAKVDDAPDVENIKPFQIKHFKGVDLSWLTLASRAFPKKTEPDEPFEHYADADYFSP